MTLQCGTRVNYDYLVFQFLLIQTLREGGTWLSVASTFSSEAAHNPICWPHLSSSLSPVPVGPDSPPRLPFNLLSMISVKNTDMSPESEAASSRVLREWLPGGVLGPALQ